ncbi:hypothetical protein JAAARDRAFT_608590 [Jaapia argillacea MUCL 33604]|uniref:Uncharacterized protein n=1 Tax=Jaapia argillacea MUCL 33604 TaxID=933084 RepID=A0A067Q2Y6_9AGAM|nr:hypothetical protein JAAARDRAFT_608590 [Jaapia argillacea MUCL 33604]
MTSSLREWLAYFGRIVLWVWGWAGSMRPRSDFIVKIGEFAHIFGRLPRHHHCHRTKVIPSLYPYRPSPNFRSCFSQIRSGFVSLCILWAL